MTRRSLALLVTVLALGGVVRGDDTRPGKAEMGKLAPDLKVRNDSWINTKDQKPINLNDLKGKVVLIDFWGVW